MLEVFWHAACCHLQPPLTSSQVVKKSVSTRVTSHSTGNLTSQRPSQLRNIPCLLHQVVWLSAIPFIYTPSLEWGALAVSFFVGYALLGMEAISLEVGRMGHSVVRLPSCAACAAALRVPCMLCVLPDVCVGWASEYGQVSMGSHRPGMFYNDHQQTSPGRGHHDRGRYHRPQRSLN